MSHQIVGTHDLIDLQLQLEWQSDFGRHQEIRHFPNYNVWRDLDSGRFEIKVKAGVRLPSSSGGRHPVSAGSKQRRSPGVW
jgi:hypothetical protein